MKIDPNAEFGTRECPSCAVEVAANQNRCPICGYEFPALPVRENHKIMGAIIMLVVFIFGAMGLWYWFKG